MVKKLLYYGGVFLSIAFLVISVIQDVKPEWFTWLDGILSNDPEVVNMTMKALGLSGLTGIPGFSLVQKNLRNQKVEADAVKEELKLSFAEKEAELNEQVKEVTVRAEQIEDAVKGNTAAQEQIRNELNLTNEELAKALKLLTVNAQRNLVNPLVTEEDKAAIKEALYGPNYEDEETT